MRGLNVRLLGRPRLEFDGQPMTRLLGAKPQALVFYLAAEGGGPVARGQLATLLWGALDESAARANLRLALTRLRQRLPGVVAADAGAVGLSAQVPTFVDLRQVESAAALDDEAPLESLEAAASSCRGPFLDGFELSGAEAFDDWVRRERARSQRSAQALLRRLAERLEARGTIDRAIAAAQQWIELDDTDEAAHCSLMRLMAASGQRTAAIAQYESLRRILIESLGARPSAQTYELYRRIHADAPSPPRPATVDPEAPDSQTPASDGGDEAQGDCGPRPDALVPVESSLPDDSSALIGRAVELDEIERRLLDPQCRALTLVGPGGIGKTRLVLTLARELGVRFADGAVFLSAASLGDGGEPVVMLADAIAAQAGVRRGGSVDVGDSLAAALAERRMLLVLDNLESVPDAGRLVSAIADGAPGIKVLATSRRRLGGRREWLYDVPGLALVADEAGDGMSAAARLFVREAARLDPAFDARACLADIERICAMVGGMPLAIEIAARALRAHGCAALAHRIAAGGALVDPDRDRMDPHGSIERIIAQGWTGLGSADRDAAMRLAILPGAFDPGLAMSVAGVSPASLEVLRDQSWLRVEADGRLMIHPLQRDYAGRQARAADGLEAHVLERLTGHWLAALRGALADGSDAPGRADASALEQLRACATWLIGAGDDARLVEFVDAAANWLARTGAWKDAARLIRTAVARNALPVWQRGIWVLALAEIESQAGDVDRARADFVQGLELLGYASIDSTPGTARDAIAVLSGRKVPDRSLTARQRRQIDSAIARAMTACGQLAAFADEPAQCSRLAVLAWALARRAGDRDLMALAMAGFAYGGILFRKVRAMRPFWRRACGLVSAPDTSRAAAGAHEAIAAYEYAAGHWHQALPRLDETAEAMRRFRQHRYEIECRSLAAKILALQGRFGEAQRRFLAFGEQVRGSESAFMRHWSLLGIVETGMRTGSHEPAALLQLLAEARREMSEMETIDSAYVIRWLGLRATVCLMTGDAEAAREAALAGAGVIARSGSCGVWAHEGFGGIVEALIACRERDRSIGMSGADLAPALRRALGGMSRQVGRFPPGKARLHFCRGLLAQSEGRRADAIGEYRRAASVADGYGMRYELARACERMAALEGPTGPAGAELMQRARALYEETGARADLQRQQSQA